MALPGGTAFVCYGEGGPRRPLYHARLLGDWVADSDWAIITPDFDVYVETLDCGANRNLTDLRFSPGEGRLPVALHGARVYDFGALDEATRVDLIAEARGVAVAERRRRGLPAAEPAPEPAPPVGAPVLPVAGAGGAATPVVAEAGGLDALRAALGPLGGGGSGGAGAAGGGDARTLAVKYADDGGQYRDFREAVALMQETQIDQFVVRGPRTCLWVLRFMAENGGTPLARHTRFKVDGGLSPQDPGVSTHESLCKILQVAVTSDQLDCSNLGSLELVAREVQMIEEKYADRLTSRAGQLTDESHYFTGTRMSHGNVCMSPELREWISSEMRGEAAVMKERRKAREERELLRGPAPKKQGK